MPKLKAKKTKKPRGYSEKLVLAVIIWVISVFERGLYFAFKNYSENIWMYIIPAVGTILSAAIGLHIWKTKSENVIKISANPDYDREQMVEQLKNEMMYGGI
jgi:hypothetical protein